MEWEASFRGAVPSARHAHAAVVVDGYLYVLGGYGSGGVHLNDVHRCDLRARTWEELHPPVRAQPLETPPPVHSHSVVAHNGALYQFGGVTKASVTDATLYRFGIATRRWSRVATAGQLTPPGRWGHAACVVGDEMVVFGGMRDSGALVSDVVAFSFATLVWRRVETAGVPPVPSHHHAVATVGGSAVFLFGGFSAVRNFGALFSLDFAQQPLPRWSDLSAIPGAPEARRSHSMVAHGSRLYVFGGRGSRSRLADLCCFDAAERRWLPELGVAGEPPCARGFHSANLFGSTMVIFGGIADDCLNDLFFLRLPEDPSSAAASSLAAMQQQLGPALGKLFEDGLFADVQIVLKDDESRPIPAHRAILASRSEHFRALLTSGLAETRTGEIVLEDVRRGPLLLFLRFLYTDRVELPTTFSETTGNDLVELLVLADRFLCLPLRIKVEALLAQHVLTPETASDLLSVAEAHNGEALAARCSQLLDASSRS